MNVSSSTAQARSTINAGIKFALTQPDGTLHAPESSSSKALSDKMGASAHGGGVREKQSEKTSSFSRPSSYTYSPSSRAVNNNSPQASSARPPVRTIPGTFLALYPVKSNLTFAPAWVKSPDEDDLLPDPPSGYFLPDSPQSAFTAQHYHFSLAQPVVSRDNPEDYRTSHGLLSDHPLADRISRWTSFSKASAYPKECWQSENVDRDWLKNNMTDYSKPWLADHDENDVDGGSGRYRAFQIKRKTRYKRIQQTILRNPMIPLVLRMTVFTFSTAALGLGGVIYSRTNASGFSQGPSTLIAIILDVIALVYIVYITYDEYTGKPLGLRSAKAKLRILFLDLFFIVFQSANLSLAFQALSDPDGACKSRNGGLDGSGIDKGICSKQKALASVLLVALIAWLNTFCVSILR
jgi:hypothetical protein